MSFSWLLSHLRLLSLLSPSLASGAKGTPQPPEAVRKERSYLDSSGKHKHISAGPTGRWRRPTPCVSPSPSNAHPDPDGSPSACGAGPAAPHSPFRAAGRITHAHRRPRNGTEPRGRHFLALLRAGRDRPPPRPPRQCLLPATRRRRDGVRPPPLAQGCKGGWAPPPPLNPSAGMPKLSKEAKQRLQQLFKGGQFAIRWGFIPVVLYLGFKRGADPGMPEPTIWSLLWGWRKWWSCSRTSRWTEKVSEDAHSRGWGGHLHQLAQSAC